jgi:uncharacterized protein (DUF111 family)
MRYVYLDASAGLSGDMILAALLDLGVSPSLFKKEMADLKLGVDIQIKETKRASLRGLKVDVQLKAKKSIERRWEDVETLIKRSHFASSVKKNSLAIFKNLFQAEAAVHGHDFEKAHLHEAGADDAIVDIVGTCFLVDVLGISEFYSSPLNLGQGWVKTSHGSLPVPPPAVAELLKGLPVYSAWVKEELVTPTGAAIVSTLAKKFIPFPEICYEKIGCGAGARDFPNFPNILATKLTVLAETDKMDSLIQAIFKETSSIGVRYFPVERRVLERKTKKARILGEDVAIKVSCLEGKEVNVQPEFSDCLKLAKKKGLPLKEIIRLALDKSSKKQRSG